MTMTGKPNDLIVLSIPGTLKSRQQRTFLRTLVSRMRGLRPRLVLDCSRLDAIDGSVIRLMLSCLEEALKRNGDVKLAGVAPTAKAMLESTGASRLFRIFASNADAIRSFFQSAAERALLEEVQIDEDERRQHAA